ncbi:Zinc finger MYND domain-containing protein 12 [Allomyces javanicus]|nr:Zinc finger MYND domain-containing protein 12 [Allomyces javanicus]
MVPAPPAAAPSTAMTTTTASNPNPNPNPNPSSNPARRASAFGSVAATAAEATTMINPLANPKGVKHECELCARPAHFVCPDCRSTYYCDKEHQMLDHTAIHGKVCAILKQLRSPVAFLGSEEERKNKEREILDLRKSLLTVTRTDAQKLLFEGEFAYAIPAALQALRCAMAIYGHHSLELVPCYLLLGEASIGLHQYNQAEEYLASAKWALVKSPSSNLAVQAKLARNFGLLYHSRHQSRDAAAYLARAIFYASQHLGDPDHIHVAGAYFQLGQVFADDGKVPAATAAFGRVLGMWARWVRRLVAETSVGTADREGASATAVVPWHEQVTNMLDVAQRAECHVMLARMAEFFASVPRYLVQVHVVAALVAAALGDKAGAHRAAEQVVALEDVGAGTVRAEPWAGLVDLVRLRATAAAGAAGAAT